MSTLRDEVEALNGEDYLRSADREGIVEAVLAIIDAHEAKIKPCKLLEGDHSISGEKWCGAHTRWAKECVKPSEERPARETGWLVERYINGELYFLSVRPCRGIKGNMRDGAEYSRDVNDAIRFAREEDATVALFYLCKGEGWIAAHVWMLEGTNTAAVREAKHG